MLKLSQLQIEAHLMRLRIGAQLLAMPCPVDVAELQQTLTDEKGAERGTFRGIPPARQDDFLAGAVECSHCRFVGQAHGILHHGADAWLRLQ